MSLDMFVYLDTPFHGCEGVHFDNLCNGLNITVSYLNIFFVINEEGLNTGRFSLSLEEPLNMIALTQVANCTEVVACAKAVTEYRENGDNFLRLIARLFVKRVNTVTPLYADYF